VVVAVTVPVRLGVDVGGTFTDVVLVTDDQFVTAKTPTTADQSEGVLEGIETACTEAGIEVTEIDTFAHAMTVSVNALLERDGARTLLLTTEGFRDVLEIGRQDRPDLYDLFVERAEALVPRQRRLGVEERATVDGIETELTEDELEDLVTAVEEHDPEAIAVSFLHAYATPENEQRVASRLREHCDVPVSVSHEVLSTFREYERTATTVANAYVTPAIDSYLSRLVEQATERGLPEPRIMHSSGGVATPDAIRDRAITTALSGPAAGVVGAGALAGDSGADEREGVVSFDMGGTSTDVSLLQNGAARTTTEASIAGQPIAVPMVDVETVGSGGGSIAWVDEGGALRVGPESTGAEPGPACYDRGGTEPTVTDAQVVLGYLGPEAALGGTLEIDAEAAHDVLGELAATAGLNSAREAARGVFRVANATMTRAIRRVTVERGTDPRQLGLVAFGGAGPVHAAAIAERLSIGTVVVPLAGGVLSAYGLLAADETQDVAVTHRTKLAAPDVETIEAEYEALVERATASATSDPTVTRAADCRYAGQSFELRVPAPDPFDPDIVAERFHRRHEQTHGYRMDEPVELVTLRVRALVERTTPAVPYHEGGPSAEDDATVPANAVSGSRRLVFPDSAVEASIYERRQLPPGSTVTGPAVIEDTESTAVVPPEWHATVRDDGALVLRRAGGDRRGGEDDD
jgi:N-methylhydantoinase A